MTTIDKVEAKLASCAKRGYAIFKVIEIAKTILANDPDPRAKKIIAMGEKISKKAESISKAGKACEEYRAGNYEEACKLIFDFLEANLCSDDDDESTAEHA